VRYDDYPHAQRGMVECCAICGGPGGSPVHWSGGMPEPVSFDTGTYVHGECIAIVRHRRRVDAEVSPAPGARPSRPLVAREAAQCDQGTDGDRLCARIPSGDQQGR